MLGPVLRRRPTERDRLLGTLRAHLAGDGSVADTARRLHLHRNSVLRHLDRIETLTGRSVHRPADLAVLALALAASTVTDTGRAPARDTGASDGP